MQKHWIKIGEWTILVFLVFSVLWKGGKGLEAVWLVAGLGFLLTILTWRMRFQQRQIAMQAMPLGLWMIALAFLLFTIVSYITSQTLNYGLDEVFATAALMCMFFWIVRMRSLGALTHFSDAFYAIIASVTGASLLIGTFVYALQPVNRFVGTFFDYRFHTDYWPNAWAEYLLLVWPILVLLLIKYEKKLMMRNAIVGLLGVTIGALLLSYSRGAIIAFAGQVTLILLLLSLQTYTGHLSYRLIRQKIQRVIIATLLIAGLAAVVFVSVNAIRSLQFDVQSVADKVTFSAAEGASSVNERSQFWRQSLQLAAERPFLGWGPYSFRFVQTSFMQHVLATSDHPHNVVWKLAMERGFPAAILFLLLCGSIAYSSFLMVVKRVDMATILLISALAGVFAHNLIDFNLQFMGVIFPSVILAALLHVHTKDRTAHKHVHPTELRIRRFLIRVEVLLVVVLSILLIWEGALLGISSLGRHAEARGENANAVHWYGKAHNALFTRDMYVSMARIYIDTRAYGQAQKAIESYKNLNINDARVWKLQGELALRMGQESTAQSAFLEALHQGRYTDVSILRLAAITFDTAMMQKNQKIFEDVFEDFAHAIQANAHYIALSQNPEELMMLSLRLAEVYPDSTVDFVTMAQDALDHAQKERTIYSSRAAGILW